MSRSKRTTAVSSAPLTTTGSGSRSWTRRWSAVIVRSLMLLLIAFSLTPSTAHADETYQPPSIAPGSNAVGACLAADEVWLFVSDIDGEVLANECVGAPATGEEALTNAGLEIGYDDGGLICTLDGHPAQCPATFNGSYWNYHHAGSGEEYEYAQEGAGTRQPVLGTIEAWCYNQPEDESCTPPLLTITQNDEQVLVPGAESGEYVDPALTSDAAETATPAEDSSSTTGTPLALIITGAVVVIVALGLLVWWLRRRGATDETEVGGR